MSRTEDMTNRQPVCLGSVRLRTFAIRFHLISPSMFHQALSQQLFHPSGGPSTIDEDRCPIAYCSRSPLSINLEFKAARIWAFRSAIFERQIYKIKEDGDEVLN